MLKEFRAFVMRGNVIDLAVAVILGAAFSAIIGSLVTDVITPLLLKPTMDSMGIAELEKLAWKGVLFGKFIASVINFIVVAFCVFMMIKVMGRLQRKKNETPVEPPAPPAPTMDQELLMEIRDLLKK